MPVTLTPDRFALLEHVNWSVNSDTRYRTDLDHYGKAEFWEDADRGDHQGDCEDYAIAKLHRLRTLGWPADALRVCLCSIDPASGGPDHAVLVVETDRGLYVLDNCYPHVDAITSCRYTGWQRPRLDGSRTWESFTFEGDPT
jgi:predicted transglutaminase-like cysteine proteinase